MIFKSAAIIEPKNVRYQSLAAGLKKAGLKVSGARQPEDLSQEQLVLLGPSITSPSRVAREVRRVAPSALLLAGLQKGTKAAWADAVVPLPISPVDLKVRLAEWHQQRATPAPAISGSLIDSTTQFYSFSHFKEVLFVEVKRARRYGFPLALALLAFDAPANANATTDAIQRQSVGGLALAIRRSLRDTDYPIQYSADRILILMPHTDLAGSLIVARRILERVGKAALQTPELTLHPTISVGVAAGEPGREYSFSDLAKQAQDGLLEAIARGGNRVEFVTAIPARSAPAEAPLPPCPRF